MRAFLFLLVLVAAGPAGAQRIGPWTEAVVSVRHPDDAARLFRDVGAWRATGQGKVSRQELDYWRLPRRVTASFLRLCAPAAATGCIRFVRFDGAKQRPVRLAARPWDTGGIFSLMVRTDNVQALFDRAIALGWWAESEPIAFTFGGSSLRNVVLTGPHGINIAAYERVSPPFTAFPLGPISQAFNSMRMVRDQRASVRFYRDRLGFTPVFDSDYRDPAPQPSNFSLPQNLATSVIRRAAALQPVAGETGRVEVMQFVGLVGKDASAEASPPNLGLLSVRYPVQDLAGYRRRLEAQKVAIAYSASSVPVGGLGKVDIVAVRDPDGSITEFYEAGARH
jgi:catechol 2,3-dioxygenase-like lactoylglutathione lyase family enzyme